MNYRKTDVSKQQLYDQYFKTFTYMRTDLPIYNCNYTTNVFYRLNTIFSKFWEGDMYVSMKIYSSNFFISKENIDQNEIT